jgi:hypothetical protein
MALDCSAFPKTTLATMLKQDAFKEHHEAIKAFLAPKPKDFTPAADKVQWRSKVSSMSTSFYPSGKNGAYLRIELNQGNGCVKANALDELIAHLTDVRKKMA